MLGAIATFILIETILVTRETKTRLIRAIQSKGESVHEVDELRKRGWLDQLADLNLFKANLFYANLRGAHLENANLYAAHLKNARIDKSTTFNTETILPDQTDWTPDTNFTRFTDPKHPNFWEPGSADRRPRSFISLLRHPLRRIICQHSPSPTH